ncbi:MAG TPA: acetylglutamate kinase [Thermodesulfobium narugense]|uniref:Acetylglutamate kinase n=1 Tax=Thermodesulfobium acidiphilum TaxID=1794699 RepID=A0A2R4W1C9_THEAF|nr:acetylglutamate kinase [Thermodesulfobium acidiphilum]AWB10516.1 N-acetylglutamate kinase [Thermodesulfobium acidiphilum]PMP84846.1 MAG: acetylglutamate kinase [Thermodesulfobium narugense]HEM55565.1 acetylglutamate kinase [Thermodesulfobium narugense]
MFDKKLQAKIIIDALPYFKQFNNQVIVIKYGGSILEVEDVNDALFQDIVLLSYLGVKIVLIHGGGPEISRWQKILNIETKFIEGLRVTDSKTMEITEMILSGKVNKNIVAKIQSYGGKAVGICGKDGGTIVAKKKSEQYGFVGEIVDINPSLLAALVNSNYVPVMSPIAYDEDGSSLNINADFVAGKIAISLKAKRLLYLTDVPGILLNKDDPSSVVSKIKTTQIDSLIEEGILSRGMIPKTLSAKEAIESGVEAVHIIDGREPHSLLLEVLTPEGVGTMIVSESYDK